MKQIELSQLKTIDEINRAKERKFSSISRLSISSKKSVAFEKIIKENQKRRFTYSYKMLKKSTINSFSQKELDRKMRLYDSYGTKIKWIDFFTMVFNLGTISTFYMEHFEYIKHNYRLDTNSNIIRIVLLLLSLLISLGIFFRYKLNENSLKIISNLNKSENIVEKSKKKRKINLIVEIVIHLIQPYPYIHYEWKMKVIGQEVTYTLNLILYFLSTFRAYMLFKVIRYWNLYSSERSKKILAFFDPYANPNLFTFKANVKMRGFITLCLIGGFTLVMSSLLLKTMEYDKENPDNKFYYYWNSLWYLVVTMCTIGYGDIVPATVLGRFVGVIICLIGVLILSLIVVTLTLYTNLDKDEEEAYKDIKTFSTSYQNKIEIQSYVNKLLSYRFKNQVKKVDLDCVLDRHWRVLRKTKVNIELKKHNQYTYSEFTKNVRTIVDENIEGIKKELVPIWNIDDRSLEFLETNENLTNSVRRSKNIMTSCMNLANSLTKIGGIIKLDYIHQIQHKKIIDDDLLLKAKEKYLKSLETEEAIQNLYFNDSYTQLKYTGRYKEFK